MRRPIRTRTAVALVAAGLALVPLASACTSSNAKAPSDVVAELGEVTDMTSQKEVTIEVVDNSYAPKVTKVAPGTKVTFRNTGANPHNVTPFDDGVFEPIVVGPGEAKDLIVPQKTGDLPYYCTIHGGKSSGQRGALVIANPF